MRLRELKHGVRRGRGGESGGERGRRCCSLEAKSSPSTLSSSSPSEAGSSGEENRSTEENTLFAPETKIESQPGLVPAGDAASSSGERRRRWNRPSPDLSSSGDRRRRAPKRDAMGARSRDWVGGRGCVREARGVGTAGVGDFGRGAGNRYGHYLKREFVGDVVHDTWDLTVYVHKNKSCFSMRIWPHRDSCIDWAQLYVTHIYCMRRDTVALQECSLSGKSSGLKMPRRTPRARLFSDGFHTSWKSRDGLTGRRGRLRASNSVHFFVVFRKTNPVR
jgi:hypothetical protein